MPDGPIDYVHMTIEGTEPRVLAAGGAWTARIRSLRSRGPSRVRIPGAGADRRSRAPRLQRLERPGLPGQVDLRRAPGPADLPSAPASRSTINPTCSSPSDACIGRTKWRSRRSRRRPSGPAAVPRFRRRRERVHRRVPGRLDHRGSAARPASASRARALGDEDWESEMRGALDVSSARAARSRRPRRAPHGRPRATRAPRRDLGLEAADPAQPERGSRLVHPVVEADVGDVVAEPVAAWRSQVTELIACERNERRLAASCCSSSVVTHPPRRPRAASWRRS